MDIDEILDGVMGETKKSEEPAVKPSVQLVKKPAESAEIKPWLASTANVQPEFRDKWTKLVREDLKAIPPSELLPSYAYRSWWDSSASVASSKILQDLVRKSATNCNFDDTRTTKLVASVNPITDSEVGKHLQMAYTKQLIGDLKEKITKDPNYSAEKFPSLAKVIGN